MMTTDHKDNGTARWGSRGFSLIELMIVVAILGILGAAVGVYINNADAKLRSYVFNLGSRFKQAKFEAMKRGRDVYLDFDIERDGVINNGYTIWVDNVNFGAYDPWDSSLDIVHGTFAVNGVCDDDEGADCVIDEVEFPNKANLLVDRPGPEIYNATAAFPTGGPEADGPGGKVIDQGVPAFPRFRFRPSGDCANNGTIYIYFPRGDVGAEEVASGPWSITVSSVGRITMDEWMPETGWQVDQ